LLTSEFPTEIPRSQKSQLTIHHNVGNNYDEKKLRKYFYILLIIIFSSCNLENTKEINYEFYPSFSSPISYKIDLRKDFLIIENDEYSKKIRIKENHLKSFLNEIQSAKIESSLNHTKQLLDGIDLRISIINRKNDSIILLTSSPKRAGEELIDYKLIDPFFDLVNKTINDSKGQVLTENTQNYFDYDLQIRKINSNPLEYRIWGNYKEKEIIDFLDKLPNEPVILDSRYDFPYDIFKHLKKLKSPKEIYFYGLSDLTEAETKLRELNEQLRFAEKSDKEDIGRIRVRIRETEKYRNEQLEIIDKVSNLYLTKDEILKTIANNAHKK
jgi:hypothetical protein